VIEVPGHAQSAGASASPASPPPPPRGSGARGPV
jgi:hypothetical protein